MQKQKGMCRFAGLGDPTKPLDFNFKYVAPVKKEIVEFGDIKVYVSKRDKPDPDRFAGLSSTSDDEGTFTKSAPRFKAGDQIRVKSRGAKVYVLTYINPAMGRAYSLAATSPDGSIAGVFDETDVVAA